MDRRLATLAANVEEDTDWALCWLLSAVSRRSGPVPSSVIETLWKRMDPAIIYSPTRGRASGDCRPYTKEHAVDLALREQQLGKPSADQLTESSGKREREET
mmetsp:Transcript_39545/g.99046  ORF Transcript_39545/g.99046 Transcript_39545/m.99046 type:complete len:102 (-) Transcript_39545:3-308(-)